jgi:AbrB family looped-hinge helix DNA binding protein
MNAFTKMSEKGQVVVPKAVRERLGWRPGTDLEVVESSDAVTLRRRAKGGTIGIDEAIERLKRIYRHEGPPVPIESLGWSADIEDEPAA